MAIVRRTEENMEAIYEWKMHGPPHIDPGQAYAELERIKQENGGFLVPDAVVEASRSEDALLHPCFTWDDTEAARQHRLNQARQVIRMLVVHYEPEAPRVVRAYHSVNPIGYTGTTRYAYVNVQTVLETGDYRQQVLRQALKEIAAWRTKYNQLEELGLIFQAIDQVQVESSEQDFSNRSQDFGKIPA